MRSPKISILSSKFLFQLFLIIFDETFFLLITLELFFKTAFVLHYIEFLQLYRRGDEINSFHVDKGLQILLGLMFCGLLHGENI